MDLVTSLWADWRRQKQGFSSLAKWWEAGKSGIKGNSIHYCSSRSLAFSVKRDILSKLATHLKEKVDDDILSLFRTNQSVLCQLADLDKEIAMGQRGGVILSFFVSSGKEAWSGPLDFSAEIG